MQSRSSICPIKPYATLGIFVHVLGQRLREHKAELGQLVALEMGKSLILYVNRCQHINEAIAANNSARHGLSSALFSDRVSVVE